VAALRKPSVRAGSSRRKLEKVRQRVPNARTAFGGGVCRIRGKEAPDRLVVSEHSDGVDIAACDFGMLGEDFGAQRYTSGHLQHGGGTWRSSGLLPEIEPASRAFPRLTPECRSERLQECDQCELIVWR
jgi:hypothetical protein